MIAKITGKIDYLDNNNVVIDVKGIGYQVFVTDFALGKLAGKNEISLNIFTYVREDTLALYGFVDLAEKEMFELLIGISGIGPKAAMGILSVADPKSIRTAIMNNDPTILTKVSGVGKKIAERVILELQNKVADLTMEDQEEVLADNDALEALVAMGYSLSEAREALKLVPADITDIGERIKMALRVKN